MSSSFRGLLRHLEVSRDTDTDIDAFVQKDTRPLPPSRRVYGPWHFVMLWVITGSFNVGGWTTASSLISLGLNVWQAMLVVIIAYVFSGFLCLAGGAPGAKWHIGFPFIQRSVWGMRGGLFPLVNRIFLSFVWTATNTWYGGQCLRTFITALWPSFARLDRPLAGGTMDVSDFASFVLFLVLCAPLMWVSPEKYRTPFALASGVVTCTVVVLLIWSMTKAGGGGALLADVSTVSGVKQASGAKLGWMFMSGITSTIGGIATHMFSQSDYTRYARKPGDQILAQVVMVPLGAIIMAFIGLICTSCAAQLYPQTTELLWQPYAFLDAIREYNDNSASARAGVAFASLAFILSQFGMVVASNAVVAGIDLAGALPRYFTIRRGGYITVLFACIMQPWQLLNSASAFLTVVGGYSVFLGPFMGIMFADYFLLRSRNLKLTDLYEMTDKSIYWYWKGVNWRAAVSWVAGVWLLLPGFAEHVRHPSHVWAGWTHLYWLAWFVGCVVAGGLYLLLDIISPMPHKRDVDDADYFGTFTEGDVLDGVSVEEKAVRDPVMDYKRPISTIADVV